MDKQLYLKEISLRDYKCFKGETIFPFYKMINQKGKMSVYQWTVFLGNNGTGKTNILKVIANMEPKLTDSNVDKQKKNESDEVQDFFIGVTVAIGDKQAKDDLSKTPQYRPKVIERFALGNYDISCGFLYSKQKMDLAKKEFQELERSIMRVPQSKGMYIEMSSPTRIGYGPHQNSVDPTPELADFKIYAYGVNRIASKSGLNTELGDTADSLFKEDVRLLNFEDWLLQLELAKSNPKKKSGAEKVLRRLGEIFRKTDIMPTIKGFKMDTDNSYNNRILFVCEDGEFKFEELGYGYQCMLAWVFDFCKRMFDRYPNSENPLAESAVVVIDEIDLHLHPKWQRGLLKALTKLFPNTQFIVSTHSPMIIQSMDGINLFVLRHQADGSVRADHIENNNWEGWQMEEILQETMDVEDGYTSEELKEKIDHFTKACSEENLSKAEDLFRELEKTVNPNGSLIQILKMQIRDLRNYKELQ